MVNIQELIKYDQKLIYKLNSICEILTDDGYYPINKVYETAIAILTEIYN